MENKEQNEMKRLLQLLEPELVSFKKLVKEMAAVDSEFKNDFNYMKMMINKEKHHVAVEEQIELLINELNHFAALFDKLMQHEEACEKYLAAGLLDKSVALQNQIMSKMGSA